MGPRLRLVWDIFLAAAIIGLTSYIIYDAVAETEETIEPPADDVKEYAESVRVCTNPHDKIQHPDKYPESPLDEYVWRDDGAYNFTVMSNEVVATVNGDMQVIKANFTSQLWLPNEDWYLEATGNKYWIHWLTIFVPLPDHKYYDERLVNTAALLVEGGSNKKGETGPPDGTSLGTFLGKRFASFSGAVSISLEQIPNGRMRFKDWNDGNSGLSGDSLIGYTWRRFLETGGTEHERLLLMPMAKAAVLAFNATSDILQQVQCGRGLSKYPCRKAPLEKYMPWGYSKRGWTAWLTAAVDYKRVAAVNPIVLSFLNMIPNFHHYWRAFGGWSFAMSPYYQQNITKTLDDDLNIEAAKILDPFTFKDRLIMPKLVISAAGDEFFMADDTHYWLKDMKGPTYFRLLPNAEHATVLHRRNTKTMYFTMRQFFLSSMLDLPMPDYCTTRYTRNDGRRGLRIQTNDVLRGLDAFIVDSRDKKRRDYRFIQVREGTFKPFELETSFPGFEGVFENEGPDELSKEISLKDTLHYQFDKDIAEQNEKLDYSLTVKANVWQHYSPHQNAKSEYEYDYYVEMEPGELGYRAFMLNAQFQGSFDAYGWWETTSEVQFADINHDPFDDCHGEGCYGTLV